MWRVRGDDSDGNDDDNSDGQVPLDHLEPCHTCDATGRDCKKESEGGAGVSGVDFVLYVSSVITEQCLEAVGELQ